MISHTQSLTEERFMEVNRVYWATFQRSSVVFCDEKPINLYFFLIFCESLLRQAAKPFGIILVTFHLTVPSTFSVLMRGIFYEKVSEAKLWFTPWSNFFQTTCWRSFDINRWSLNRDVLSTWRKLVAKLQQLQLYGNQDLSNTKISRTCYDHRLTTPLQQILSAR